jgi:hypothetical protein
MATTKITNPELFDLGSLDSALKLPSGTTAERPTSPSTGEWRYNTTTNLVEFWDGGEWRDLQSENIPPIPSENFNVVTFTGDNTASKFIEVGFTPDFVWIKPMPVVSSHALYDSTRGDNNRISSNSTGAQGTVPNEIVTNGFNIIGGTGYNDSSLGSMVAWCWKANGGTTSSNTEGSITSTVQANTKAGFSIVSYTGTFSAATVGHGLSAAPEMVIVKNLDNGTAAWRVWQVNLGGGDKYLSLNETSAVGTASSVWNGTVPTSTVFSVANDSGSNGSGNDMIAYCFHSVAGYSKFGSYTGTGSAGNAQNLGFEPAFVLIKRTDSAGAWSLYDNKRSPSNPRDKKLVPNSDAAENNSGTTYQLNFLTNGFEFLGGGVDLNASGGTFIYIAFASDPSAAPVLADSFGVETYQGNGSTQSITGLGFTPSMIWFKGRTVAYDHGLYDILRGGTSLLYPNLTQAETITADGIQSFNSDGVTVGSNNKANASDSTYVAWAWKANSLPSINTDGTIQTLVSANPASGFSVMQWTGPLNSSNGDTFGHGLNQAPEFVIMRQRNTVNSWWVWHKDLSAGNVIQLNSSAAENTALPGVTATSTTITTAWTSNTYNWAVYCFHSVAGYSKISSYSGNGSTQSITGLGFQPDYVLIKETSAAESWRVFDSARGATKRLFPDLGNTESTASDSLTAFDSDGFSLGSSAGVNQSGQTYIYMAYKENPTPYPLAGNMSFLVIAGGGSGGARDAGPGGAGGLRTSYGSTSGGGSSAESDITLAAGTYTITIGAGGAKVVEVTAITPGNQGVDSSLSGTGMTTVTSLGGGKGGDGAGTSPGTGGSGGGGTASQSGGSGTSGQGFAGATGTGGYTSGGGGGAGATGNTPPSNENGGAGGAGLSVSITGSSTAYAGGGGGSGDISGGAGGTGGGGAGQSNASLDATSGTANTGGGGGSHRQNLGTSGAGGSGVVVLRLLTSEYSSSTTGSPTVTTDGDYTVLTYTGSGTYVHS